ncbi:DUF92 domain-containing protein [Bacillus dakarensis]|uniref:DUF92 domain-containing protein n=1 Tax=Robertmurraya dakarensis TaxID=1926278 RepID=UPI0009818625|nr:DUF92 domain-containing protein [Bacillus dakarensis]
MSNLLILTFIIIVTAFLGYQLRFLSISGSIAAFSVGILTVLGLGIKGLILLGVFFATSSFWSKYKRMYKSKIEERHEKGSQRDWQQVMANGGAASIISICYLIDHNNIWIYAFSILIASSNSDTWASEVGTLSRSQPISIVTFSRVAKGTSGAVSILGTITAVLGSLLIAGISSYLFGLSIYITGLIFLFGFLGNVIDSILGATLQAVYRCETCHLETEKTIHCGKRTTLIHGFSFLNNDVVNFCSSLLALLIGLSVYNVLI